MTGGRRPRRGAHTIFLMLGRLKLPVLRCFWTWLAEPWRVRPPLDRAALGDSCTFSLSTPGGRRGKCSNQNVWVFCPSPPPHTHTPVLLPGECWEVASEVMELDRFRLAVMLSWLWLVGGYGDVGVLSCSSPRSSSAAGR